MYHRHFPILGPKSYQAALGAECAGEQNAFWPFHDLLFQRQGRLNNEVLKEIAQALGLTERQFDACIDSMSYDDFIQQDQDLAHMNKVLVTPTIFISVDSTSIKFQGNHPFQSLQNVIDQLLGTLGK